jgi:hypothetical protein
VDVAVDGVVVEEDLSVKVGVGVGEERVGVGKIVGVDEGRNIWINDSGVQPIRPSESAISNQTKP